MYEKYETIWYIESKLQNKCLLLFCFFFHSIVTRAQLWRFPFWRLFRSLFDSFVFFCFWNKMFSVIFVDLACCCSLRKFFFCYFDCTNKWTAFSFIFSCVFFLLFDCFRYRKVCQICRSLLNAKLFFLFLLNFSDCWFVFKIYIGNSVVCSSE